MLEYDKDEGSALISGGQPNINTGKGYKNGDGVNGSGLWIFTRRRERDEVVINYMRRKAEVQGFDLSVLNVVDQTDCGKNRRLVTSTSPPPTTSQTATSPPTPRPTPSCDAELTNLSDCLNDGIEDGTCLPVVRDTGGCLIAGTYAACGNSTLHVYSWPGGGTNICRIQCSNFNNGDFGFLCSGPAGGAATPSPAAATCDAEVSHLGDCIIEGIADGSCAPVLVSAVVLACTRTLLITLRKILLVASRSSPLQTEQFS